MRPIRTLTEPRRVVARRHSAFWNPERNSRFLNPFFPELDKRTAHGDIQRLSERPARISSRCGPDRWRGGRRGNRSRGLGPGWRRTSVPQNRQGRQYHVKRLSPDITHRGLLQIDTAGWFGPIGVSALFYAMLVHRETGEEIAWIAGSLLVAASLVAHGMSAAPIGKAYGRHCPEAR